MLNIGHEATNLLSLLGSYNMTQVVDFPTRITNNSRTMIDTVFVDLSRYDKIVIEPVVNGISDHDAQLLCLSKSSIILPLTKPTKKVKYRLINEQTLSVFKSELQKENWEQVYESTETNKIFNSFHNTLLRICAASFPLKYRNRNLKGMTWITNGIQISCRKKRELFCRCRENPNNRQTRIYYNKYCKILKQVINEAKKQFFQRQIATSTNKVKTAWKIVKENTASTRHDSITKMKIGGTCSDKPREIANALNNHYVRITDNINVKKVDCSKAETLLKNYRLSNVAEMKTIPVTESEIISILKTLKCKNSAGYDGISTKILKYCSHIISRPLAHICNVSLTTGVFPERCKYAIIRPIHKKGDTTEMDNYRPISLLITCSKILERVMLQRLIQHLKVNKILSPAQFGFQKDLHIDDAVYFLLNNITTQLENRRKVGCIFCDLTKAFDCVNHGILLNKLCYYGVSGVCHAWFKSYLTNRKQKVTLLPNANDLDASSNWKEIVSGVPQGSILGPMLFVLYVNDLSYNLDHVGKAVLYADDTSVLFTATNEAELLNKVKPVLSFMTEWFSANGLVLNMEKTNIVNFTPRNYLTTVFEIVYQDQLLKESSQTKFLGLELDKNLNWRCHTQRILPKLSSTCYLLRRMSYICNLSTLKMIYFAYFHSIIEYGIIFWGISTDSKKILIQQKRIIRIMTGSNSRTSCRALFRKLEILTVPSQFIYSTMRFLSANLERFVFNSSVHSINTRSRLRLHKTAVKLKVCQCNTYNNCINIYNKLPDKLALKITEKKRFLLELRNYLSTNPYYSLEEFLNKEQI
jgi:hypothetical protein